MWTALSYLMNFQMFRFLSPPLSCSQSVYLFHQFYLFVYLFSDETATVRVTNLSENTKEQDLHELFRPFGDISRIFLAKDKNTGQSKGFAFINFKVSFSF